MYQTTARKLASFYLHPKVNCTIEKRDCVQDCHNMTLGIGHCVPIAQVRFLPFLFWIISKKENCFGRFNLFRQVFCIHSIHQRFQSRNESGDDRED